MPPKTRPKPLHGPLHDDTILVLEGCLQELGDADPQFRPRALPAAYLAARLNVSIATFQRWLVTANKHRARDTNADLFVELHGRIATELCEVVASATFKIAANPSHPSSLAASKFLLAKIDAAAWGESLAVPEDRDVLISDISQEIFDELTADENDQIEVLQARIDQAQAECEALLQDVQKRLLDRDIAARESKDPS